MSRNTIIVLMYYRHKLLDLKKYGAEKQKDGGITVRYGKEFDNYCWTVASIRRIAVNTSASMLQKKQSAANEAMGKTEEALLLRCGTQGSSERMEQG
jgi:hypothetical protein